MRCDYFKKGECTSCCSIYIPYTEQLSAKNLSLHSKLDVFVPLDWREPVTSPEKGFRNKAKMAVLGTVAAPLLGIVNHKGNFISLCDCPLYPEDMQALLHRIQNWIRQVGVSPYQIAERIGELKFVLLTRSQFTREFMLRLVLRSEKMLMRITEQLPRFLADNPSITAVSANIQPVPMAVIEGDKEIPLSENTRLMEKFNGVTLFIRPKGFFQTNSIVAEKLYATAREWATEINPIAIWDLYCGVGGFGLHCANADTSLTGIEIEPEAIACAQQSAAAMGLTHVSFAALDSAVFASHEGGVPDLIIVNPPRRGLGVALCKSLDTLGPKHIFYSSCNPETLVRDLSHLPGYQLDRVQLFDMFPHTAHYEVLVKLSRRHH